MITTNQIHKLKLLSIRFWTNFIKQHPEKAAPPGILEQMMDSNIIMKIAIRELYSDVSPLKEVKVETKSQHGEKSVCARDIFYIFY